MRKPIFTRSRSLPYNETGWLCFKVHLGGGRRGGGGGVGGIGNWKNWNLPECVWKLELWFFFFFQAYPKQRRKIIKQPRLICHKLFFRRQTSLQTRHVFFFKFASLILVPHSWLHIKTILLFAYKRREKTSMIKNANVLWFGTEN